MDNQSTTFRDSIIGLLVIGSIWGLAEIVVGGAMKAADIPHKGDILTAIGMGLMAMALAVYRKPSIALGIALVAASMKQLAIPILGLSFFCKANSCLAVALGGASLTFVASMRRSALEKSWLWRPAVGATSASLASIGFYFIGMRLAPCNYLLSFNRPGGLIAFIAAETMFWAGFSAIGFPIGYLVGSRISSSLDEIRVRRPQVYYGASMVIITFCWIGAAVAIANGM